MLLATAAMLSVAVGPHVAHARIGVAARQAVASAPEATPQPAPESEAATADPEAASPQPEAPQPDPAVAQAMDAYRRGTENFNAKRFEEALADYQTAASLYASADFQYNIARCHEELGDHHEAVRAFKTYLRAKPDAKDRAQVENRIKLLDKLIEQERQRKEDEADKQPQVIVQQLGETREQKHARQARPLMISGGVLLGVGAAVGLGGGLGFGLVAKGHSDDLDAIQTGGNPDNGTFADAADIADKGESAETLQIATAAAGGGLAVIGTVLLVVGLRFKKGNGNAAVMPTLGPRRAGLSLTGRF